MHKRLLWLRPYLLPLLLIALGLGLTYPVYLALEASYQREVRDNARVLGGRIAQHFSFNDREVLQNAKAMARRIELHLAVAMTHLNPPKSPLWPPLARPMENTDLTAIDKKLIDTLRAELVSDTSVQTAAFYTIIYDMSRTPPEPDRVQITAFVNPASDPPRPLPRTVIDQLATRGASFVRDGDAYHVFVPWMRGGRMFGITYLRVSRDAWIRDFWKREQPRIIEAINKELKNDVRVQVATFYSSILDDRRPGQSADNVASLTLAGNNPPSLTPAEFDLRFRRGFAQEKGKDDFEFWVPASGDGMNGLTYIRLSREVMAQDFRNKEWPLMVQVMWWSISGVLALGAIGMFVFMLWQRTGRMRHRAELDRHGMLAERGLTAAVLAHEIRNPLQALRFQLHSLKKNADKAERVGETAQTIDAELMRIHQLVSDYLEHEKAVSFRTASVDLLDAAEKLKTLMDELLRQTGTKLTVSSLGAGLVMVTCDPHALRQVLMNLVINAQQAMVSGGHIHIRVSRDQLFGVIDVEDTGPGIPQEMRDRLFKPFQTSKKEGHGIGLALVKRFVDNFGGSVTVDSQIGKGTTFHLRLPLTVEEFGPTPAVPVEAQQAVV